MKLIQKGFVAGTGRLTQLLEEVLKTNPEDHNYFISDELIADGIEKFVESNKDAFSKIKNFNAFGGISNIQSMVEYIISSQEEAHVDTHINLFVHNTHIKDVDFNGFINLDNLTIYHYVQTNREAIINK